ncbi:MAG: TonB-dependent receptor, partial [Betaproteobacteria bacterium]|nr:TonB-dependent receptor [Betaproteobacteria bacterium]
YTSQSMIGGTLSSDLGDYGIKLPGAKSGVGIAFGFESRKDELQLDTDSSFTTGDLAGQGGPTIGVAGTVKVKDYFLEGRVPILEGQHMAHLLSVNGSYRRSDYDSEKTNSFGLGIEWAPTKKVKLRGSYQEAVRAANVIELFTPQGLGLYNNDADPCAGATPTRSLADCARTGVTAAQYGRIVDSAAGQYNGLFGGNPNLKPETAKSQTLGLVLEPTRDLSFTFDYFNIKVEDVIGNAPPTTILTQCLDAGQFCNLIQRDQLGTLWATPQAQIVATNQNLGKLQTSGIDITANYNHKIKDYGSLNLNLIGTYLKEYVNEPIPGLGEYDCAGFFGATCGTPLPEWRHKARATWNTPWNLDLAVTWRYIGEVKVDSSSSNALLAGTVPAIDSKMDSVNYIDLAASWYITKTWSLTGGINNLFDQDPPIVNQTLAGAPFGNGNTYPVVYDALGRKVFITVTAKF